LFGGSRLQASALQKGPFATAKQHLIACRNRAQTYPQKVPNVPSEFLEKISFAAAVVVVVVVLVVALAAGSWLLTTGCLLPAYWMLASWLLAPGCCLTAAG